ncbi:EAL domain-containing protein [Variovorax sp. YR752]|uniref:EAL domain-containing protein n=1 Tax=Variovorax sp. YR752 TaxID=1884383 RepID=UPI0031380262
MSLIGQIWLKLFVVLMLAFVGSVAVHTDALRGTLQTQLRLKNADNATAIALVLSQQKGDAALMELVMSAQFDTGFYRRIRFVAADGEQRYLREAAPQPLDAPAWFERLLPIEAPAGVAQVSDGWRALGRVEVQSQDTFAHDELWYAVQHAGAAMAVVGLLAALAGALIVNRIRRPLELTVEQARSLERGEYVTVAEPSAPELRRLVRAMNSMVARLKLVFEGQATQVETLRRQANCDPLTGLSNRAHFMGQLGTVLQREDGSAEGGLVLLRVIDLAGLNRALGHDATDGLIRAISQALQAYTLRVKGCFVGRLNGSDFAMCLPVGGVAEETARALAEGLRAVLPAIGQQAAVAAGAVELQRGAPIAELMGMADLALARAEAQGAFAVATAGESGALVKLGEGGWRRRLHEALAEGRVGLVEYPVRARSGEMVHLECPLRVQIEPEGALEPAARWLPLAARARLTAMLDERALALALAAISADGQSRAVNLAVASLADSGFAARLRAQLLQAPRAARQVWLEVPEIAAAEHFELVRELGRQLRPVGARVGLEHAGERLGRIERLFELGLDYVKLDAAVTLGIGRDSTRAGFVTGVAAMLHSLSLQVIAEGVSDAADAEALWQCGVDAQTGPWVSGQSARRG